MIPTDMTSARTSQQAEEFTTIHDTTFLQTDTEYDSSTQTMVASKTPESKASNSKYPTTEPSDLINQDSQTTKIAITDDMAPTTNSAIKTTTTDQEIPSTTTDIVTDKQTDSMSTKKPTSTTEDDKPTTEQTTPQNVACDTLATDLVKVCKDIYELITKASEPSAEDFYVKYCLKR